METTRHSWAMVGAAAVPTAASVLLVLVIGPVLPAWATWAVVLGWPAAVALAVPPAGERWLPALIWRARPATPAEQHTLAYALGRGHQEVAVPRLRVRITTGDDVRACGARTLLVGEGVVAAGRQRRHLRTGLRPGHADPRRPVPSPAPPTPRGDSKPSRGPRGPKALRLTPATQKRAARSPRTSGTAAPISPRRPRSPTRA